MSIETVIGSFWNDAANGIEPDERCIYPESRFHWRRHKEQLINSMLEVTGKDPEKMQYEISFEEFDAMVHLFKRIVVEVGRVEVQAVGVPLRYSKGRYFIDTRYMKGVSI